jgi:hypothetical protein
VGEYLEGIEGEDRPETQREGLSTSDPTTE